MRHGLVELSFKVHKRFATECVVEPLPVVKDFDPLENGCETRGFAVVQYPTGLLSPSDGERVTRSGG